MLPLALILSLAFITTYFGVEIFRRWSINKGLLDIPNDRSSHITPTPRGGGLVIAVVTLAAYVAGGFIFNYDLSWGYLVGAALVVVVSSLDDAYSVSMIWRFLIHGIAACLLLYDTSYLTSIFIPFYGQTVDLGAIGIGVSFVWIVWLINSYNFMDGIDGIAGIQAVVAGVAWMIAGYLSGAPGVVVLGGVVMSSSGAFLLHNWQPARIFMGDAGSAFLGFTFAAIPFVFRPILKTDHGLVPLMAILFVWFFVFDSVFTFLKRLFNGEKVWQAHRQHIYQRLIISGLSHQSVSLIYGLSATVVAIPSAFIISEQLRLEFSIFPLVLLSTTILLFIYCRTVKSPKEVSPEV